MHNDPKAKDDWTTGDEKTYRAGLAAARPAPVDEPLIDDATMKLARITYVDELRKAGDPLGALRAALTAALSYLPAPAPVGDGELTTALRKIDSLRHAPGDVFKLNRELCDIARAALARAEAQPAPVQGEVPEGWRLVPVKATDEMLGAWSHAEADGVIKRRIWEAMLAAAPPPSHPVSGEAVGDGIHGDTAAIRAQGSVKVQRGEILMPVPPPRPVSGETFYCCGGGYAGPECESCAGRSRVRKPPPSDGGLREALEARMEEWFEDDSLSVRALAREIAELIAQHGGEADE